MEITTLDALPINSSGIIDVINCKDNIKHRLLDLGLVRGTKITPYICSPFGDPIAYYVRGFVIAIRNSDANKIQIKKV